MLLRLIVYLPPILYIADEETVWYIHVNSAPVVDTLQTGRTEIWQDWLVPWVHVPYVG